MTNAMDPPQDDKTILLDHQGRSPTREPLTDFAKAPRFEQLEDRMIYAAQQAPARSFNPGLNPLVAAAGDVLAQMVRLKNSPAHESLRGLNQRLSSDLKLFEARANYDEIENSQVIAARYVLCCALDEAVVTTSWGNESEWSQMSLLSSFHNETFGGEKFFVLLAKLSGNPLKHLPLLELMYLCLSLGFEGKYRVIERGGQELEGIRDALYRQIRHVRGDSRAEQPDGGGALHPQRRGPLRVVPLGWLALFTLICLAVMYGAFAWVLQEQRESVLRPYLPIESVTHRPQP